MAKFGLWPIYKSAGQETLNLANLLFLAKDLAIWQLCWLQKFRASRGCLKFPGAKLTDAADAKALGAASVAGTA